MATEASKISLGTIFAGINALATVCAVVGGVVVIGQRDAQLTQARDDIAELKSIVREIAETQANMITVDAVYAGDIARTKSDIQQVLERLNQLDRKTL